MTNAPLLVAAALFALGLLALHHLLAPVGLHEVMNEVRATPWPTLALALLATAAGYACLAAYDVIALRHIGKALPLPVALGGGLMAYAFGNTIGLTAITGGAVRWRVYGGLGLDGYDIAAISTFSAVSFGLAVTALGLFALVWQPTALAPVWALAPAVVQGVAATLLLALVAVLVWAARRGHTLRLGRFALRAPTLPVLGAQFLVSVGDIGFSALTLYLLLPASDVGFVMFLAVFAVAVMAGVLSHVPGGIGVFETVVIAAMPAGTSVGALAAALLSSALGAGLLLLALGVARRSAGAWWLTVAAMLVGVVVALAKELDVAHAAVLLAGVLVLLPFRRRFRRRTRLTHAVLTPGWRLLLMAALAGFGFVLFFAHKGTPYANELWWQFAVDEQAPRALRAGLLGSLLLGLGALYLLLRAPHPRPARPDAATLATVAQVVDASDEPDAAFALTGDKAILLADDGDAFVMYAVAGRTWLAYGAPVGEREAVEQVAFRFIDAARCAGARPVFYEIGVGDVPLMLDLGLSLHKMGEEAVVDLRGFSLDGPPRKKLRAAHARAGRDGLTLEVVPPPHDDALFASLAEISAAWLRAKNAREKGFSVGRFERAWLDRWPLPLVRQHGRIVAFANILHTRTQQMASIDLMRHADDAPAGTMDFLFTALMLELKAQGYAAFSLGMAPLSGLEPERSLRLWDRFGALVYRHGGGFYNFAGLRAFKEKFDPDWHPRYLAAPSALPPVLALADAARVIAQPVPATPARLGGQ